VSADSQPTEPIRSAATSKRPRSAGDHPAWQLSRRLEGHRREHVSL